MNIEDVNDEVPQLTGQFTVFMDEERPAGTVVPITMNVVDGDAADTDALIYRISGKISFLNINAQFSLFQSVNLDCRRAQQPARQMTLY